MREGPSRKKKFQKYPDPAYPLDLFSLFMFSMTYIFNSQVQAAIKKMGTFYEIVLLWLGHVIVLALALYPIVPGHVANSRTAMEAMEV